MGAVGWGPNWGWASVSSREKATDGKLAFATPVKLGKTDADVTQFGLEAQSVGTDSVRFIYTLTAQKELPLTAIVATLGAPAGGQINAVLTDTAGAQKPIKLPAPLGGHGTIKSITLSGGHPLWRHPHHPRSTSSCDD